MINFVQDPTQKELARERQENSSMLCKKLTIGDMGQEKMLYNFGSELEDMMDSLGSTSL